MDDKWGDLIVYLLLTVGASAIGWFKSTKEKKAKTTRPEFHFPEEEPDESDEETVVISREPETVFPEPVPAVVLDNSNELQERAKKEMNVESFGKTDEERYAILEQLQQARRGREKKTVELFKEEEKDNVQLNDSDSPDFEFDIRQAIISSEILNRKY